MSTGHTWRIKNVWVGVRARGPFLLSGVRPAGRGQTPLVGAIAVRSGEAEQHEGLCTLHVEYLGKMRTASGGESREFPFHMLTLEEGEEPKGLDLAYLGRCNDGVQAFVTTGGLVRRITYDPQTAEPDSVPIPPEKWQLEWESLHWRMLIWETCGVERVIREIRAKESGLR